MVRWYRRDDMDTRASADPEERIERIRELVDELEGHQHLVVSMLFFGAGPPTFATVADELGISSHRTKEILHRALDELRSKMLEEDGLGEVLAGHGSRFGALLGASPLVDDERSA